MADSGEDVTKYKIELHAYDVSRGEKIQILAKLCIEWYHKDEIIFQLIFGSEQHTPLKKHCLIFIKKNNFAIL